MKMDRQAAFTGTKEMAGALKFDTTALETYLARHIDGFAGPLDVRQAFGHAVDVGLAADQADIGMLLGLPDEVLAGAESHFQPEVARIAEKCRRIELLRLRRQFQPEPRQQCIEQRLLAGPELLAAPAAVERPLFSLRHITPTTSRRR